MTRSRKGEQKYVTMENKGSNEQRTSISKLHGIKKEKSESAKILPETQITIMYIP